MSENEMIEYRPTMPSVGIHEIIAQVQLIEQCIKNIMKPNLHYGIITGCGDKPTLLKPGAEMLAKLFQLRPSFSRERIALDGGHVQIISSCTMHSRQTGLAVGEGAGSCSTMESKYRWRKAQPSCPSCGVEGSIGRSKFPPKNNPTANLGWYCRDCKAQFDYDDANIRNQKSGRVENPDIADQFNTVQKMADKRAYVAAVITTVGASDFVTQDIEDFPDYFPTHESHQDRAPASPKEENRFDAAEKIKAKIETLDKTIGWEEAKKEIAYKWPGESLSKTIVEHESEINKMIEEKVFQMPF
jgi:hypothetical protein